MRINDINGRNSKPIPFPNNSSINCSQFDKDWQFNDSERNEKEDPFANLMIRQYEVAKQLKTCNGILLSIESLKGKLEMFPSMGVVV